MLRRLEIKKPKDTCVRWFADVPWLAGRKEVVFQPGVSIVVGPNGSGKSTLLVALARMLHCEQGGVQKVTSESVANCTARSREKTLIPKGLVLEHDGSPVMFADPNKATGLIGGLAGFDSDFFSEGVASVMFKGSFGQTTLQRLTPVLDCLAGGKAVPVVEWKCHLHQEDVKAAIQAVLGEVPESPIPTLLLDEPTRGLDIDKEYVFWAKLNDWVKSSNVQVVVASHSMFCYNVKDAHYIETVDGFRERVRDYLFANYREVAQ